MGIAVLPRMLSSYPFSAPIAILLLGFAAVSLPLGLQAPDPLEQGTLAEHLTEIGVIVSLTGAGLKIDRPPGFKSWSVTWRLLGITMILTIIFTALTGWWIAAFAPATALLLGAVIAPTDPVLASEIQISSPGDKEDILNGEGEELTPEKEDEVRFALTSEAGLNDSLAFPFTNMAIAVAVAGAAQGYWFTDWLLMDVFYKLGTGCIMGIIFGFLLGKLLLSVPAENRITKVFIGMGSLAATFIIYGATEYIGGYGFLSTFIGAVSIRNYERSHPYHETLHLFAEKAERILMVLILIALGGSVAGGLFEPLNRSLVLSAFIIVLFIRPATGVAGLIGYKKIPWRERLAISFLGIRGIGSLYYLAFAMNQFSFPGAEEIWALTGLVVVLSIFIHGISGASLVQYLDDMRKQEKPAV